MNKKIKILIVDDEPLARQNIRLLLKDDSQIEIIGECGSGHEALKVIRKQSPDLMFLDIQMPEMSGFDLLANLKDFHLPAIVFVTAYDQYALNAFEVHAVDYLLKPFNDERFEKALKQAKIQIENSEVNKLNRKLLDLIGDRQGAQTGASKSANFLKRLMVKSASRIIFLNVEEIDWIGAEDYYVKVYTGKKHYLLRESLSDLESRLDPNLFVRIHRSTIVNINCIKELQPHFKGDYIVVLNSGLELKLSRSRREQVQMIIMGGSNAH